ncbi:MAG: hypothetical protein PHG05_02360 [Candidatus Nanoarchaeia archaeon]|nr:hypothetical protein [Candidatus Nanoarchaeia archaeon]
MKITEEHIQELIKEIAGPDVIPLVLFLKGKKNISEFKLAEKLKLGVNQVRNMLYRINEYNLVHYTRKKDKSKGWYIYYWTFDENEAKTLIKDLRRKKLEKLKNKIHTETGGTFFVCPEGCLRMDYADAMEHDFVCKECGTKLVQLDNQKYIYSLNQQIKELEEELNTPEPEIKVKRTVKKVTKIKQKIKKAKKIIKPIAKKKKRIIRKISKNIRSKKRK